MRKNRILNSMSAACFLLAPFATSAQNGAGAAGGDIEEGMYRVSYSIGQCFFTSVTQEGIYISSGLQHPTMQIIIGTDIEEEGLNPEALVYPNPVNEWLKIKLDAPPLKNMSYALIDMSGRIVQRKKIVATESIIQMAGLPQGTYILNIFSEDHIIRTFKLIKQE